MQESMMENTNKPKPTQKVLVLIIVIAFILAGWLTGHILRFAFPTLWHPPAEKITPQIQNGFESKGIRREIVLSGAGVFTSDGSTITGEFVFGSCVGSTFYTSLPAKCRSVSGELVLAGRVEMERLFIPPEK
ncbi:MAG: hypothetical protein PVJ21_14970 [Anaerolineales bacterium]|jgi:hypothetical protein